MTIPTGERWVKPPGNLDPLHLLDSYADGEPLYGIPPVLRQPLPRPPPVRMFPWPQRKHAEPGDGLHFFVDDYSFEAAWKRPERYADAIRRVRLVLSPDFSVFYDKPRAAQIWNVYRARWLCRRLQELGGTIVPAMSWGDSSSYGFAFLGVPAGSCVAVSTVGRKKAGASWDEGYVAMIDAVDPELVFCVGPRMGDDLERLAEVRYFASFALSRLRAVDAKKKAERAASREIAFPGGRRPRTNGRTGRIWAAEEAGVVRAEAVPAEAVGSAVCASPASGKSEVWDGSR